MPHVCTAAAEHKMRHQHSQKREIALWYDHRLALYGLHAEHSIHLPTALRHTQNENHPVHTQEFFPAMIVCEGLFSCISIQSQSGQRNVCLSGDGRRVPDVHLVKCVAHGTRQCSSLKVMFWRSMIYSKWMGDDIFVPEARGSHNHENRYLT